MRDYSSISCNETLEPMIINPRSADRLLILISCIIFLCAIPQLTNAQSFRVGTDNACTYEVRAFFVTGTCASPGTGCGWVGCLTVNSTTTATFTAPVGCLTLQKLEVYCENSCSSGAVAAWTCSGGSQSVDCGCGAVTPVGDQATGFRIY